MATVWRNEINMETVWIDPPNGWRYGFPKAIPVQTKANGDDAIKAWLLLNGYPQYELDNGGHRWRIWSDISTLGKALLRLENSRMRKTRLDRLIERMSSNG